MLQNRRELRYEPVQRHAPVAVRVRMENQTTATTQGWK
jgi:hypothetical protein